MSDASKPVAADQQMAGTLSHRRILIEMAAITLVMCVIGLIVVSSRFSIGILVGGILSFVNYFWLKQSTKAIFEKAIAGEKPVLLTIKYIFRYVLIGVAAAFFYFTDALPVVAVVIGLAAFAFAIVLEGLSGIFTGSFKKEI